MLRSQEASDEVGQAGHPDSDPTARRLLRELDGAETLQLGKRIRVHEAAVHGSRLQDWIADFGVVAVGQHMVVGKNQPGAAGSVSHGCAQRPGGDLEVANAHTARRRSPAIRSLLQRAQYSDLNDIRGHPLKLCRDQILRSQAGARNLDSNQRHKAQAVGARTFDLLESIAHTHHIGLS